MKQKINLIIDAVMFIVLMAIAGIGFLIKYVLIPGYKRTGIYEGNEELYFGGLTRHQWGNIHLLLSFLLLFLLVIHIVLHWKIIVCIFKNMVPVRTVRVGTALLIGFVSMFFAMGPLFFKPEIGTLVRNHIHQNNPQANKLTDSTTISDFYPQIQDSALAVQNLNTQKGLHSQLNKKDATVIEISGYQTLIEVADKYNADVFKIAEECNIPQHLIHEKLGRLRKSYSFTMDDIRTSITRNDK